MGKHIWCESDDSEVDVCSVCGSAKLRTFGLCPIMSDPCPPWSSASEGDTKTYLAVEVNELKSILALVEVAQKHRYSMYSYDRLTTAEAALLKLIQKHEAKEAAGRE